MPGQGVSFDISAQPASELRPSGAAADGLSRQGDSVGPHSWRRVWTKVADARSVHLTAFVARARHRGGAARARAVALQRSEPKNQLRVISPFASYERRCFVGSIRATGGGQARIGQTKSLGVPDPARRPSFPFETWGMASSWRDCIPEGGELGEVALPGLASERRRASHRRPGPADANRSLTSLL